MALLLNNGAVFLHIPKTGGNWVRTMLRELGLLKKRDGHKHTDIDRFFASPSHRPQVILGRAVRDLLRLRKSKPFMFCFVRNPLSWYESWFKYMSQPSRQWRYWGDVLDKDHWHPTAILDGLGSPDFNQFVRNVIRRRPGFVTELFGAYTKAPMEFIGKQENLVDDFINVLRIMNLNFDEDYIRNYGRVGKSPELDRKIIWENSLKNEVAMLEYAGMVRYGYRSELSSRCDLSGAFSCQAFQGV